MADRYRRYRSAPVAYYGQKRAKSVSFFYSPQWLLDYPRREFHADRRGLSGTKGWRNADHAQLIGGALVLFFYNYKGKEGGTPYRAPMEKMLRDELRGQLTPDKAREHLGIAKDTDGAVLDTQFAYFILRTLRSSRFPAYAPGITAASGTRSR